MDLERSQIRMVLEIVAIFGLLNTFRTFRRNCPQDFPPLQSYRAIRGARRRLIVRFSIRFDLFDFCPALTPLVALTRTREGAEGDRSTRSYGVVR